VCPCQVHAPRRSLLRGSVRAAARGAAVLVSIPLAIAFVDISRAASGLDLPSVKSSLIRIAPAVTATRPVQQARTLPIFTTEAVKEQFLSPARAMSLEVFKEQYFRTHVPFGEIIYREARKNDLPPELVAAMVHTESDFRPGLVSNKSAQGLMQIIPSTAALLGIDDPFDPAKNIAAGTKYYKYLLDRFDDQTMALAAYNAGEGNVARFGGIPPFAETRSYISKVSRRERRYREGFRNSYIASVRLRPTQAH
jgi:soluble lytic murein transglycosylase-like protein